MMPKITEIMPDDIPDWARQAMSKGQFFNVALARITQLEADKRVLGFDKGLLVETLHQCIVKSESQHKLLRGFIDEVIAQVKGADYATIQSPDKD